MNHTIRKTLLVTLLTLGMTGLAFTQDVQITPGELAEVVSGATDAATPRVGPSVSYVALNPPPGLIYDNGPFINGLGTGVGGANESILQNTSLGMNTYGFGHQVAHNNRICDDFTVPPGESMCMTTALMRSLLRAFLSCLTTVS